MDNFVEETLIISTMWKAFKWFATESCIQLIWMLCDEIWQKSHILSCQKCQKSGITCYAKNVENPATFVEGFWTEFQARGRFMKYSMSGGHQKIHSEIQANWGIWFMKYKAFQNFGLRLPCYQLITYKISIEDIKDFNWRLQIFWLKTLEILIDDKNEFHIRLQRIKC